MNSLTTSRDQLAAAIRSARRQKNLTQQKLAELSGVHQTSISDIEKGVANPSVETVFLLLNSLGLVLIVKDKE